MSSSDFNVDVDEIEHLLNYVKKNPKNVLFSSEDIIDSSDTDSEDDESSAPKSKKSCVQDQTLIKFQKTPNDDANKSDADQETKDELKYYLAPGFNLFQGKFLKNFSSNDLHLKNDFDYEISDDLLKSGFKKCFVDKLYEDSHFFVEHLFPSCQSRLIRNNSDFQKICNYLFYCCSSFMDDEYLKYLAHENALLNLLKNYSYKWGFGLEQIYTALLNHGIVADSIMNKDFFKDNMLLNKINSIKSMLFGGFKILPKIAQFYTKRDSKNLDINVSKDKKNQIIKRFIILVANIVTNYPHQTHFLPKVNYGINQLILSYVIGLVVTEKDFLHDSFLINPIKWMFYSQLNTYTKEQWGMEKEYIVEDADGDNDENFVMCEIYVDVLIHIGREPKSKNIIRTWDDSDIPSTVDNFKNVDHFHNFDRRLYFLPDSIRGNLLKKTLAYFMLQEYIMIENNVTPAYLRWFPKLLWVYEDLTKDYKKNMMLISKEYYALCYTIKLIDWIVGSQPSELGDIGMENLPKIRILVESYQNSILNTTDATDNPEKCALAIRTKEFLNFIRSRWTIMTDLFNQFEQDKTKANPRDKPKTNLSQLGF